MDLLTICAWTKRIKVADKWLSVEEYLLQGPVFFPEPLPVHQQREALFESELARVGGFQLLVKSIRHSGQFHGVQFFNRRPDLTLCFPFWVVKITAAGCSAG
jgi:hypothetical protein